MSVDCYSSGSIFDPIRIEQNNLAQISIIPVNETTSRCFTFATYDRFKSEMENHFNVGGSTDLNFKLFEAGAKADYKKAFHEELTYTDSMVYGELNIERKDTRYKIKNGEFARYMLASKAYDVNFLHTLYNQPMDDWFSQEQYSDVVVSSYSTGGVANIVLYAVKRLEHSGTDGETALEGAVNAALNIFGRNVSINGSAAGNNHNSNSTTNVFKSISCCSRIYGGEGFTPTFSSARDFSSFTLNLTDWLSSLGDPNKHRLVALEDGGFIPLYKFIQEKNFRNRMELKIFSKELTEPQLLIYVYKPQGVADFTQTCRPIVLALKTRHGDLVLLRPFNKTDDNYWSVPKENFENEFRRKAMEIGERARDYYDLDVVITPYPVSSPLNGGKKVPDISGINIATHFLPNQMLPVLLTQGGLPNIDFRAINEGSFSRFKHPYYYSNQDGYGLEYLLYNDGKGTRLAYSLYNTDILDMYGLRTTYNSAPEVNITLDALKMYTIVGL